jgi:hypothetical protein
MVLRATRRHFERLDSVSPHVQDRTPNIIRRDDVGVVDTLVN